MRGNAYLSCWFSQCSRPWSVKTCMVKTVKNNHASSPDLNCIYSLFLAVWFDGKNRRSTQESNLLQLSKPSLNQIMFTSSLHCNALYIRKHKPKEMVNRLIQQCSYDVHVIKMINHKKWGHCEQANTSE